MTAWSCADVCPIAVVTGDADCKFVAVLTSLVL
jgi:hypothetical protein